MVSKCLPIGAAILVLLAAGCAPKRTATPPPPAPAPAVKQNVFVLLPEPGGKPGGITVSNTAGSQSLAQSYEAVRVARPDLAPGAPFTMDQAEVRRLFGPALDVLPAAEAQFIVYFIQATDRLTSESEAKVPEILAAIRERRSTDVSVTGHTDTTGDPKSNYELGLKRAQRVAGILMGQGLAASNVFVTSHGEADLLVKTPRGVDEQRNRRVEVIVR